MKGLFVTGTDTGVGKTILACALLAVMSREGLSTHAYKPVVTGLNDPPSCWPQDHVLLGAMSNMSPEQVSPTRYLPAVSPHFAAALAGAPLRDETLLTAARQARAQAASKQAVLVVEGVGGLLVPLTETLSVADLARSCGLPLLIAARPGLGTISHTLLTIEAARAAGLKVRAVVLTPWQASPSALELSNRETITRLSNVEVAGLPRVEAGEQGAASPPESLARSLAAAGETLPWQAWL